MYPDANQLAIFRADAAQLLLDTCTLQKPGLVDDGAGGKKRGLTTVATNEPCRVDAASGGAGSSDLGPDARVSNLTISLRWDSPITRDCQVVHGGHTYEIFALIEDQSHQILKTAQLTRIDP